METITGTMQSPPQLDPDRWERVKTLWVGSVSSVEEIVFQESGQAAILKQMHPEHLHDPGIAARCINEGLILRFLHASGHAEGIPKLLAMGMLPSGCPALVLERLGDSLAEHLGDCGPQSSKTDKSLSLLFHVGLGISRALGCVHGCGVVHRDVRPDNILFGPSLGGVPPNRWPQVYLIDFGLAKVFHPAVFLPISTGSDDILGTDLYMAPEQWESAKHVTAQADIYSLGVVLYLLAAGRHPFEEERQKVLMYKHLVAPPPELPNTIPKPLSELIAAMLSKRPQDRPTARECTQRLLSFQRLSP